MRKYLLLFLTFSTLTHFAHAEEESSGKWNFQIAPYAWLAGQEGKVATLPGLPPADIDVNFYDDILGNINWAGMLVGEARRGRYGLVADIVYTDIETEDPAPYGVLYSAEDSQPLSVIAIWMSTMKTRIFFTTLPKMV
jgi:hypothetical protein